MILLRYTLSTPDGFEVSLISYGATIQSIRQSDKQKQTTEITLGYDDLQSKKKNIYIRKKKLHCSCLFNRLH